MPRKARRKTALGLYHVVEKGIDSCTMFYDERDYQRYISILERVREKTNFKLYAYCLMGNHVHLLIREDGEALDRIFKRIGVSYAQYYNTKYERHGALLQGRFWSEPVSDEAYFYDVIRYICQNPIKAGLCAYPEQYKWLGLSGFGGPMEADSLQQFSEMSLKEMSDFIMYRVVNQHDEAYMRKRITDRNAIELLKNIISDHNITLIKDYSPDERNVVLAKAIQEGISYRQLSRITGIAKHSIEVAVRRCGCLVGQ